MRGIMFLEPFGETSVNVSYEFSRLPDLGLVYTCFCKLLSLIWVLGG